MKELKSYINKEFLIKALMVCLLVSLFFPIRHVFLTKEAYLTGNYSDFTSFSLYLSDILLFCLAILIILPRGGDFYHVVEKLKWLILAIFVIFLVHFGLNMRLNSYLLAKWLELIVAYGTFTLIFEQNTLKNLFLKLFAWLCGLESILALVQFAKQSSIGIYKLGESLIGPNILGIAKIVSGGTTYIRGYGTFPHPNPFSAFLIAGILITIYFLINSNTKKLAAIYSTLLFINILGLTVTFSRGAYLALAAGLVIFFGSMYLKTSVIARSAPDETILSKNKIAAPSPIRPRSGRLESGRKAAALGLAMTAILITVVSIIVSFFLFKPFLLTRATFSDQSTMARKFYDITGVKMAVQNPIFGVGLGESLLHMEQYLPATNFSTTNKNSLSKELASTIRQQQNNNLKFEAGEGKTLAPWDKQPPHNYFILAAAELGIPAMLILIWVFLSHFFKLVKQQLTTYNLLLITIFLAFLLLMQFDHYFYTLDQTQLLLWIFLALIASEIKNPQKREC